MGPPGLRPAVQERASKACRAPIASRELQAERPLLSVALTQVELGRCLAVACGAGAVQRLAVRWLGKTQLKLGHELAACGSCASVRSVTIDGEVG